ncbi:DUF6311 domain-containing protein [Paracidovorax citrulli]
MSAQLDRIAGRPHGQTLPRPQMATAAITGAAWIGGALIGLAWALWLYGPRLLDATNVGWLLHGGDLSAHYLGWDFFRRDAWHWPPGANPTLGDIARNSIVFSDAFPLLALLLKPLHALLPDPLQYQGIVLFGNLMLNGAFAAALALRLGGRLLPALLMAALMAAGTIVTARGYGGHSHETLTAHWLVLAALMLAWKDERSSPVRWALLLVVAALTHFYLLAMVIAIWGFDLGSRLLSESPARRASTWQAPAVLAALGAAMYLAGYFTGAGSAGVAGGFGHFSANLLTFFDPGSTAWYFRASDGVPSMSSWLPDLPEQPDGQYEGNAYMGAGLLLMVGSGIACAFWRRQTPSRAALALSLAAAAMALLAFTHVVVLGSTVIARIPLPDLAVAAGGVVRASGRFIWPLYYVIAFGAFAALCRALALPLVLAVLVASVALQVADLAPWHRYLRQASERAPGLPQIATDAIAGSMLEGARRMVFVPAAGIPDNYGALLYLAARRGMAVNATYSARTSLSLLERADEQQTRALLAGNLRSDEAYVVGEASPIARKLCGATAVQCHRISDTQVLLRQLPRGQ